MRTLNNIISMNCIILAMLLANCLSTGCAPGISYEGIDSIKITFVNKGITTPFSVSCSGFEGYFSETYKKITITDSLIIGNINKCLQSNTTAGLTSSIDVRGKMYLVRKNEVIAVYCYDRTGTFQLNDKDFFKNKCLADLIDQHIK